MGYLRSDQAPQWKKLDLFNLPARTPALLSIKKAALDAGFDVNQEILQPAPSIQLPSSWEDFLNSLDDRYREEINRKNRNAESYFLPVDWYIASDQDTLDSDLDAFLDLMADNPEKARFLTGPMRKQIKDIALSADREGWLQLAFLTVGGVKAAGYLNFDFQNVIWVYNSGINSTFENISPGWVLLSRLIEWAIQQERSIFDFMRGDEAYKYQFGGKDQHVVRITIHKN
jgi:CelD/BcsL family acetyltransferase involved in cellulose biosynthesis